MKLLFSAMKNQLVITNLGKRVVIKHASSKTIRINSPFDIDIIDNTITYKPAQTNAPNTTAAPQPPLRRDPHELFGTGTLLASDAMQTPLQNVRTGAGNSDYDELTTSPMCVPDAYENEFAVIEKATGH